jgi:hypothetical protein
MPYAGITCTLRKALKFTKYFIKHLVDVMNNIWDIFFCFKNLPISPDITTGLSIACPDSIGFEVFVGAGEEK